MLNSFKYCKWYCNCVILEPLEYEAGDEEEDGNDENTSTGNPGKFKGIVGNPRNHNQSEESLEFY